MRIILLLCFLLMHANASQASVLTFDDIISNQDFDGIPNGYGGFDWSNMQFLNTTVPSVSKSGYKNGVVSGNNVAFNSLGEPATLFSNVDFTFNGAYLTAAWKNDLTINVKGYKNTQLLYDQIITVSTDKHKYFNFDFVGIDTLVFSTFGGIDPNPIAGVKRSQFAMDNLTVNEVPLPGAFWYMGIVFYGLLKIRRNT